VSGVFGETAVEGETDNGEGRARQK